MLWSTLDLEHLLTLNPALMRELLPQLLKPGSHVDLLVKAILGKNLYLVLMEGILFEATIPLDLEVGDRITTKVQHLEVDRAMLSISRKDLPSLRSMEISTRPYTLDDLLERAALPKRVEVKQVLKILLEYGAPITKDTIQKVLQVASEVPEEFTPRAKIASFLISRALEPSLDFLEELMEILKTRVGTGPTERPAEPPVDLGAIPAPLERILLRLQEEPNPESIKSTFENFLRPLSLQELSIMLPRIFRDDPKLRFLDMLIEGVKDMLVQSKPHLPRQAVRAELLLEEILTDLKSSLQRVHDELPQDLQRKVDIVLKSVEVLDREGLEKLLKELLRIERQEIARWISFRKITLPTEIIQFLERQEIFRTLNEIYNLRQDGVFIAQLPLLVDGKIYPMFIRIQREGKGFYHKPDQREISFVIELELSRLGRIRLKAHLTGRMLKGDLRVKTEAVCRLLRENIQELVDKLSAIGLSSSFEIGLGQTQDIEEILLGTIPPQEPSYRSIDIIL